MSDKSNFEWSEKKNIENQSKHGVSFYEAQFAFADENRIILEDLSHSQDEKRYYYHGKVGDGILTVRFTHRDFKIRIIGAGYWRKGKKIYEERNKLY
ncbi:MAG: BrnT family toxin [Candidatus Marinimicrobia bacterium]|nr:BrnT family toxin [Candidatus Neomarinimicrobiota bacterium]